MIFLSIRSTKCIIKIWYVGAECVEIFFLLAFFPLWGKLFFYHSPLDVSWYSAESLCIRAIHRMDFFFFLLSIFLFLKKRIFFWCLNTLNKVHNNIFLYFVPEKTYKLSYYLARSIYKLFIHQIWSWSILKSLGLEFKIYVMDWACPGWKC